MGQGYENQIVTDEERRDFLKALSVGGAAATGGVTLDEISRGLAETPSEELAPIGQAIQTDLAGTLDANLITERQDAFTKAASALPATIAKGVPATEARTDFQQVAEAGQPIYDHFVEVGFFESTTNQIGEFTPEYLIQSVEEFITSDNLAETISSVGFAATEIVDLFATIVNGRHELSNQLWLATNKIPKEQIRGGEYIAPMTQQAAGGVLLWLNDLDNHLSEKRRLITPQILNDATWHAHAMTAGFQMMTEGAKEIAQGSGRLSDSELGSLFTTGFSLQTISQYLLPHDAYWITEEMRAPRETDISTITVEQRL